jgi:hypothetical protein
MGYNKNLKKAGVPLGLDGLFLPSTAVIPSTNRADQG